MGLHASVCSAASNDVKACEATGQLSHRRHAEGYSTYDAPSAEAQMCVSTRENTTDLRDLRDAFSLA